MEKADNFILKNRYQDAATLNEVLKGLLHLKAFIITASTIIQTAIP
jgi:hypothetical protein